MIFSVLRLRSSQHHATLSDLCLMLQQDLPYTELIMDGHAFEGNLKCMDLKLNWLGKQPRQHRIQSAKEVFHAVSGQNGKPLMIETI